MRDEHLAALSLHTAALADAKAEAESATEARLAAEAKLAQMQRELDAARQTASPGTTTSRL